MPEEAESDGRLVIVGGGIAALTTAFYASEPGSELVFPGGIHVYEKTHMLGGKGASERTNGRVKNRVEEHGLHVWLGFYDNAFALMERCHAYLEAEAQQGRARWSSSLRSVADGFRPCSRVGVMDYAAGQWSRWVADFPADPSVAPWDSRPEQPVPLTPAALALQAMRLAETILHSLTERPPVDAPAHASFLDLASLPIPQPSEHGHLMQQLETLVEQAQLPSLALPMLSRALQLLSQSVLEVRKRLDDLVQRHAGVRRSYYVIDLLLASVRGLIDEGVVATGRFDLIDDFDLREWLALHGASQETLNCGLLKALVDGLPFAYEHGDPGSPACSAATGSYGLFRMLFTYRGAIMWKMNAGMGEVVFAPIYEVLKKRGVSFHFGHEVERIDLERNARGSVRARRIRFKPGGVIELGVRLPSMGIDSGPLAGELPYWAPAVPGPRSITSSLELGPHDMVVYGLPVGTVGDVVPDAPPAWQRCREEIKTVSTMALQLWLKEDVGSYAPWATPDITVGAYTEPFDTWSDMDVLVGEVADDDEGPLRSVAYFVNVAPDGIERLEEIEPVVRRFVTEGLADLWPRFDTGQILDQYTRLNADASSRYSLSVPGSLRVRLSPRDASIANVRPVGDWTRNSISAGCIEAAVISALREKSGRRFCSGIASRP
ncbi:MAG: NAD(P)-binding protein, partial [Myxococcales bacterium]|nr:NAD(P)-binding protein [Myxococcales bacterium]